MQKYDDIKPFQWYTYNDSENRTYGYTFLFPVAKKLLMGQFIKIIGFYYVKEEHKLGFDVRGMEDDENLIEWYDWTPKKHDLLNTLFTIDPEALEEVRNSLKRINR